MSTLEDLLVSGQTVKARNEAEQLLKVQPEHVEAHLTLAKLSVLDGDVPAAERHLAVAEKSGKTADALLIRATILRQRSDFSGARALYEQALALDSGRAETLFGLGTLLIAYKQPRDALPLLERAVEAEPRSGVYHYALAECLGSLGKGDECVEQLREAIRVTPMYAPPYGMLARLSLLAGQLEQARAILLEGLRLSPQDPLLLSMMTDVGLMGGDVGSAFQAAAILAQREPTDPIAQSNFAALLMAQRRFDEVLEVCHAMEQRGLTNGRLKMIEAMTLEAKEPVDIAGAARAYEEAMALDAHDWRAANNLGQLYLREKVGGLERATSRAITVLEEAHRRQPEQLEPMLNLAIAYGAARQNRKALELAQRLLAKPLQPGHPVRAQAERLVKALAG